MADSSTSVPRSKIKIPWLAIVLLICFIIPITLLVVYVQSEKSGVEFSPDDFTLRRFDYAKVEWLNWTLRGISYQNSTSTFEQSLVLDGWIKAVNKNPKTWHLARDSVSSTDSADLDAGILCNYLAMPFWQDWNHDAANQTKAAVLWPNVATLARNYAYWAIPDLMDLAINQPGLSDTEFQQQIESMTIESLLLLANSKLDESDFPASEQALTAALTLKKSKALYLARANVYDQLNETEKANADRSAAQKTDGE